MVGEVCLHFIMLQKNKWVVDQAEVGDTMSLSCVSSSGTQGGRFMTTAMFSAREAMIPGGMYDRSRGMVNGGEYMPLPYLSMYLSICLFFMLVVQEEEVLSLSLVS